MLRGLPPRPLLALAAVVALCAPRVGAKKVPVALEAGYKTRITSLLGDSLDAATAHLVQRLAMGGGEEAAFGGYELDFQNDGETAPAWRHSCTEVNVTRDSTELCGIRQLQALAAVCDASEDTPAHKPAILAHLKKLGRAKVPELGMKRIPMSGAEVWAYRKASDGEFDGSPALQAAALMATVRCANATQSKEHLQEAESWFVGLQKIFPKRLWGDERVVSFHKNAIIWEALAIVSMYLPRKSSFYEDLQELIAELENHMWEEWTKKGSLWSFSSARAIAVRWDSGGYKTKRSRQRARRWGSEHLARFMGDTSSDKPSGLLAQLGEGYLCGPSQGLAPLAAMLGDAKAVHLVLKLLERDVAKHQLGMTDESIASRTPGLPVDREGEVRGAFVRDGFQLQSEMRRSLRVDDPAQCVVALTEALRLLEGLQGVEIEAPHAAEAEAPAAAEFEAKAGAAEEL